VEDGGNPIVVGQGNCLTASGAGELLVDRQPVESSALRRVCGDFVTGVTVITSGLGEDETGTTVNSFTSLSLDPPLVLFCIQNQSRLIPVITRSGTFAVNFLSGHQERLAMAFASKYRPSISEVPHGHSTTGAPVFSEALAFLSCRLVNTVEAGDHVIIIGEVVELGALHRNRQPLIFFRGSLGTLEDEPHSIPVFDW
jgi:3-hydroxy-9,10-secoandrosta-1,3,5(10)-triene-9,17-dione monooxygenase reductase component